MAKTWNAKPGVQRFIAKPLEERFWEKVDRSGGPDACWPWLASKRKGYGQFYLNGRTRMAHLVAWELENGRSMSEGMQACHDCHNRECCNPAHIREDTPWSNNQDMIDRETHNWTGKARMRKREDAA